jgi:hypothetical protein
VEGDWRAFRARLASSEVVEPKESANRALLKKQNPKLYDEPWWSHPTGAPEAGGLLLRTPLHTQLSKTPVVREALQVRYDKTKIRVQELTLPRISVPGVDSHREGVDSHTEGVDSHTERGWFAI